VSTSSVNSNLSGRTLHWAMAAAEATATKIDGITVLFPDARSDVAFVGDQIVLAGTRGAHGPLCSIRGSGADADSIKAGGGGAIDRVNRIALLVPGSGACKGVVGVSSEELHRFGYPSLAPEAELFRSSLPLRAVASRTGGTWV
jgi:hypothetical protein